MSSDLPPIADKTTALGEAVEAYQAAADDFDREVARLLGVNETDLRCLEILLQEAPEATPRLLADRLGLTTGSVTHMLDRLERMGYLTRSSHPSDRRKLIVRATDTAAWRTREVYEPLATAGRQQLLTRYTAAQLDLITDFLTHASDLQQAHVQRLRELQPYPKA